MAVVSANRLELLQIAEAVAREKVIDRSIVIDAMEEAIAKAARSRYGAETDVHAEIDPKTGALRLSRHLVVVDQASDQCDGHRRHAGHQLHLQGDRLRRAQHQRHGRWGHSDARDQGAGLSRSGHRPERPCTGASTSPTRG